MTKDVVDIYYSQLVATLDKYTIKSKLHLFYNLDETGLQTEYRPPSEI